MEHLLHMNEMFTFHVYLCKLLPNGRVLAYHAQDPEFCHQHNKNKNKYKMKKKKT